MDSAYQRTSNFVLDPVGQFKTDPKSKMLLQNLIEIGQEVIYKKILESIVVFIPFYPILFG